MSSSNGNDLPRPRSAAVFNGPDRAAARAYDGERLRELGC